MKYMHIAAMAATAMLSAVGALGAQQQPPRVRVTPFAGIGTTLTDLPTSYRISSETGGTIRLDGAVVEDAAVLGAALGVRLGRGWAVEGSFAYMPGEITTTVDGFARTADLGVYQLGADLLWYVPAGRGRIEPYLAAGLGAKVSDYDISDAETQVDFAASFGAGAEVRVTPFLALRLDARDHVSWLDPQIGGMDAEAQHDLRVTGGLSLTMPRPGMKARTGRR